MLASHFQSTNSNENYSSIFRNSFLLISYALQHKLHCQSYKKMECNNSFSIEKLLTAQDYSNASAVRFDNLRCEMLNHMPKHCLNIILLLFNKVWFTGESVWLHSIIVPLHKPSKPIFLQNPYRPISLTSHTCKIMKRMITIRMRRYVEKHKFPICFLRAKEGNTDHLLQIHDT